jgi:hypothetical protein
VARAGDQACVVDGRPGRACIEQQGAWDSRVQVSLLIDALTRCFCIPRERRRVRLSARHGHENSTSDQAGARQGRFLPRLPENTVTLAVSAQVARAACHGSTSAARARPTGLPNPAPGDWEYLTRWLFCFYLLATNTARWRSYHHCAVCRAPTVQDGVQIQALC